jgi:hypothetical protein
LLEEFGTKRPEPEAGEQRCAISWCGLSHVPSGPGATAGQPLMRQEMLKRYDHRKRVHGESSRGVPSRMVWNRER